MTRFCRPDIGLTSIIETDLHRVSCPVSEGIESENSPRTVRSVSIAADLLNGVQLSTSSKVERVGDVTCGLGEGPLWGRSRASVVFHRCACAKDSALRSDGRFIRCLGTRRIRFPRWPWTTQAERWWRCRMAFIILILSPAAQMLIGNPEDDRPVTIFNDGKVDRRGRFIFGSVTTDHVSAVLRNLQRPSVTPFRVWTTATQLLTDRVGVPTAACFYVADSAPHARIYAYDYDLDTGTLGNKRIFASTAGLGRKSPDGFDG